MLLDEYRPHAFTYKRTVDDLSTPWAPSPVTPARQLPPSKVGSPVSWLSSALSTSTSTSTSPSKRTRKVLKFHIQEISSQALPERRKQSHLSFFRFIKRLLRSSRSTSRTRVLNVPIEQYDPAELEFTTSVPIPLSEWKAWSYYARPCVNGVEVNNLSPGPDLTVDLDLQEVFDHLKSSDGTPHPERWIPGRKHPSLPPRPALWKRVDPNEPLPFPWELQLNPLLTHSLVSIPDYTPIYWNISHRTSLIFFLTDNGELEFVFENDLCQPATYPFVTHMYICSYAFAPEWNVQHKLQWPVMIQSRDGITCEDFFLGIFDNFQQHVRHSEFDKWDSEIKETVLRSHHSRPHLGTRNDDFVKRVDFLRDNVYFRGLSPSLNMEGWTLLLGPEPPMMRRPRDATS